MPVLRRGGWGTFSVVRRGGEGVGNGEVGVGGGGGDGEAVGQRRGGGGGCAAWPCPEKRGAVGIETREERGAGAIPGGRGGTVAERRRARRRRRRNRAA